MTKFDLKLALKEGYKSPLVFGTFLLLYLAIRAWIRNADPVAVTALESTWLLIITSIIAFLIILSLCWWLLQQSMAVLGLPQVIELTFHFKDLRPWQQLGFYLVLFALLLCVALGCLIAIC